MKKISTVRAFSNEILKEQKLTIGVDLGDRSSAYCVLNEAGEIILEHKLPTTPEAMKQVFGSMPRVSHGDGDGDAFSVGESFVDRAGARSDRGSRPGCAVDHQEPAKRRSHGCADASAADANRSRAAEPGEASQCAGAVAPDGDPCTSGTRSARTALVNAARGLVKSYGERLRKCGTEQFRRETTSSLSTGLREALDPLLREVESLNERIQQYDRRIEKMSKKTYPETALLKQIKGVGDLIATTYVLTIEDPHRFRKSRDAGCFVGLQPGRRNSGESEPQMHISKEGDEYLRTLLVQGAHYILGPFGEDSDLRRWGRKLSARGGKTAKKRAVVAVARKLAVLLHRLWVSGEVYEPLRNSQKAISAAA